MSIIFEKETKTFWLDGKGTTYSFFINPFGYAEHLYFGKKIPHESLMHTRAYGGLSKGIHPNPAIEGQRIWSYNYMKSELAFFGTGDYREPAVLVENAAGDRLSDLLYAGHEILPTKPAISGMPSLDGGETLVLHLKDEHTDFCADLYYTVYDDCDVIARRAVYRNGAKTPATLRRAYSFSLSLPGRDYEVTSLWGSWAHERFMQKTRVHHGVVSIDSKNTSSSATLNPFIAVSDLGATEKAGQVWGVNLVYSSSYVLKAQGDSGGHTLLTGGINDFDFYWTLEAGESFETPEVVIAYSAEGFSGMSRAFHDAYREHLINKRFVKAPRPLVLNNWEGTTFDFNLEKLKAIVDAVEGTGIDTFVLDDGWFGTDRNTSTASLGDWHIVNPTKLPGGLKPLVDYVKSKGMKMGLWFEPECLNENSEVYRAHPDYIIGVPGRIHGIGRDSWMMDLTRKEVRDYIVETVNKVIRENGLDYVKWDYNRNVTESFSLGRAAKDQARFAHLYALGVYDLCERIVEANPNVFFEGCSAGGGRFDPAMLHYFSQIWTSDNSDAEARTLIQYGTSMCYPLSSMSCHVSAVPNHQTYGRVCSMKTRGDIAHLGATGYELDSTAFTDEDREEVRAQIVDYKENDEDLVLNGDLYRLANPFESNFFAFQLVSKDKKQSTMTLYRRTNICNDYPLRMRLEGLDPKTMYHISELDLTLSGEILMTVGIIIKFRGGDFLTLKYHVNAVE